MLILWIFAGALCGWIVALLSRTNTTYDASFYLTIGIIGALMGGLVAHAYNADAIFFNANSLLTAILTAGVFLLLARLLLRRAQ